MDWNTRFQIILGIARGLQYLHEDSPLRIVHRDIKASNVLLDDKYQPRISDFGLARFFPEDQAYLSTTFVGTLDTHLLNMQSEGSCRRRQTSTASECWFLRSSAVGRTQISTYHLSSSTFKHIGGKTKRLSRGRGPKEGVFCYC